MDLATNINNVNNGCLLEELNTIAHYSVLLKTWSHLCFSCFKGLEMVLMTMIGRAKDGLPLAASMQADEQVGLTPFH